MPNWTAFAGVTGAVVLAFLLLARASQSMLARAEPVAERSVDRGVPRERTAGDVTTTDEYVEGDDGGHPDGREGSAETAGGAHRGGHDSPGETAGAVSAVGRDGTAGSDRAEPVDGSATPAERTQADGRRFGTGELLANVVLTHGLFALLVAATAVYWGIPPGALGVASAAWPAVGWGALLGIGLYAGDEVGAAALGRLGVDHDETLRALLAPSSPAGWALLLGGVLPVVAVGEELLFRGVLVGAYAAGLGLPAWGLAVVSSAAFALGHGAQGRGGIVVTGLLGFALAAAFVVSGSLLLVVVAHYVVNALEFVVHEGLDVEWAAEPAGPG